jgi:hypothetical protein
LQLPGETERGNRREPLVDQSVSFCWIKTAHFMSNNRRRWRQINIQAVMVLTLLCATFAAGYRSGDEQSDEFFFAEMMRLIEITEVPDTWEALGGPSTMAPYPMTFSGPSGCYAEVVDHLAEKIEAERNKAESASENDE